MASGIEKPPRQAEQMPANGQPANDQLKSLAKGAPSTDARFLAAHWVELIRQKFANSGHPHIFHERLF